MLYPISSYFKNKQDVEITTSWYESKQQHTYEIGNDRDGKNKQKSIIFIVVPRVRVENQISRIS